MVNTGVRDLAAEGMFEYGSRCGIWRVFRAFGTRELCATAFTCALAVERVRGVVFRFLSSIFFFPSFRRGHISDEDCCLVLLVFCRSGATFAPASLLYVHSLSQVQSAFSAHVYTRCFSDAVDAACTAAPSRCLI